MGSVLYVNIKIIQKFRNKFNYFKFINQTKVTLTIKLCAGNVYCVCAIKVVNNYDQSETAYMDFCSGISSSNFNLGSIDSIFPANSEMNCDVLPSAKTKFNVYTKEVRKYSSKLSYLSKFLSQIVLERSKC
jgi:hypothetical protein